MFITLEYLNIHIYACMRACIFIYNICETKFIKIYRHSKLKDNHFLSIFVLKNRFLKECVNKKRMR